MVTVRSARVVPMQATHNDTGKLQPYNNLRCPPRQLKRKMLGRCSGEYIRDQAKEGSDGPGTAHHISEQIALITKLGSCSHCVGMLRALDGTSAPHAEDVPRAKLGHLHNRMEPMLKQRVTELHRWRVASPSLATASEASGRGTHTVVKCHTSPSSEAV